MSIRDRLSSAQRGYDDRWRKARLAFLKAHPLCAMCEERGRTTAATVVDHVKPHKGDARLFWDRDNWQPLCKPCHDSGKATEEARGYRTDIGADGWPLDPRHPGGSR